MSHKKLKDHFPKPENLFLIKITHLSSGFDWYFTVDFGEMKTVPTERKDKCFHMMSSAYLLCEVKHLNMC